MTYGPADPTRVVGSVEITNDEGSAIPVSVAGTISSSPVAGSAVNAGAIQSPSTGGTVLAANANRKLWMIQNLGTNPLYVKLGASATTSDFHFILKGSTAQDDGSSLPTADELYKGAVSVAGTSPRCVVTEIT